MNPTVSVVLPVHNGAAYLEQAVRSTLNQKFKDFELLIIDDCSSDGSGEIALGFDDSRIRIFRSEIRLKLSGALNFGIKQSAGKYIARMDSDDINMPDRLGAQVAFMEKNPDYGICGTWVRTFGGKKKETYRYPVGFETIRAFALFDCPFAHPTVMIRNEMLARWDLHYRVDYYPTEDFDLWTRCIDFFKAENLPKPLLNYRVHSDSMTGSEWTRMDEKAGQIVLRELQKIGLYPTEDHLRFHRKLAMGKLNTGRRTILKVESWLSELLSANDKIHVYSQKSLKKVIGDIWFRACMRASHLGSWTINRYIHSSISDRTLRGILKMTAIITSIAHKKMLSVIPRS